MEEFYPSEIARLVLGYLKEVECQKSWSIFLEECFDLREYYRLFRQGRVYSTKVNGKSLLEILGEYCYFKYKLSNENDQDKNCSKDLYDNEIDNTSTEPDENVRSRVTVDQMVQTSPATPTCETPKRKSRTRVTVLSFDHEARSVNKNKTTNDVSDDELSCRNSGLNSPVEESVFPNNNCSSVLEHRDISVQTESTLNTVSPDTLDMGIQTENLCQCSLRFSREFPRNSHEQYSVSQDVSSLCSTLLQDGNSQNPEFSKSQESLENCAISEVDEHYTDPAVICDSDINSTGVPQISDRGSSLKIITNKETEESSETTLSEGRFQSVEQIKISISKNEDGCTPNESFAIEQQNAATTSISMDMDCVDVDVSHSSSHSIQDKSLEGHVINKAFINTENDDCSSAADEKERNKSLEENSNNSQCKETCQNIENQSKPNSQSKVIDRIPQTLDEIPSLVSVDVSKSVNKVNPDIISAIPDRECAEPINSNLLLPSHIESAVKNSSNGTVAADETCDNLIDTSDGLNRNNQDIAADSEKNKDESVDHPVSVHDSCPVSVEKNHGDTILKTSQSIVNESETNNITASDSVAETNIVENQTSKNVPLDANKFGCNSAIINSVVPNVQNITTTQNNCQPYQYLMFLPMQTVPTINVVNPLMPQPVTFVTSVSSLNVAGKESVAIAPKSALQNSSVFIDSQAEKTASLPSPVGPITKKNEKQTIKTSSPKQAIGFSPFKVQCSPKSKSDSVTPAVSPALKQKKVEPPKTSLSKKKSNNVSPAVSPALKQKKVEPPKTPLSKRKTGKCVSPTVSPAQKQSKVESPKIPSSHKKTNNSASPTVSPAQRRKKMGSPKTPSSQKKNRKPLSPLVSPRLKQKRSISPEEITPSKKCKMCDSPCKSPNLKQSVVSNSPSSLKKSKKAPTPCKSPALKQNKSVSSKVQSPLKMKKDSKKRPQRKTRENRPAQDSDAYVKPSKKPVVRNRKKKQSSASSHSLTPEKTSLSASAKKKSKQSVSKKSVSKIDIKSANKSKNKNFSNPEVELTDIRKSSHVRCLNFNTYLAENNSRHDENILEEAPLLDRSSDTNAFGESNNKDVCKSSNKNFSIGNNQTRISSNPFGILQSKRKTVKIDKHFKPLSDIITVTCYPKSMKGGNFVQAFKPVMSQVVNKDVPKRFSVIQRSLEVVDVSSSETSNQPSCQTKDSTTLTTSKKDEKQHRSTICREISKDENSDKNTLQHYLVSDEITVSIVKGSSEESANCLKYPLARDLSSSRPVINDVSLMAGKTSIDFQEKTDKKNGLKHFVKKTFVCHPTEKKVISYEKLKSSVPNILKVNASRLDSTYKQVIVDSRNRRGSSQDVEVVDLSGSRDSDENPSMLVSNAEDTTSVPPGEKEGIQNLNTLHSEESEDEIVECESTKNYFVSDEITVNEKTTSATKNTNNSIHSSAKSLNCSEQSNLPLATEKFYVDVQESINKLDECLAKNEQIANINSEVLSTVSDDFNYERDDLDNSRSLMINTSPFSEEDNPKSIEHSSCSEIIEDCDSPNIVHKPEELNDLSPTEKHGDISHPLNLCTTNVASSDKSSNVPTPRNEINLQELSNVLSAERQERHCVPVPFEHRNPDIDVKTLSSEKKFKCTETKTVRRENPHLPRGLIDSTHFYNPQFKVSKLNKNPTKVNLSNNQHVLANDHLAISSVTSNYSDGNKSDAYEKNKSSSSIDEINLVEENSVTLVETRSLQFNDKSNEITNESTAPFKKRMRHRSYENSSNSVIKGLTFQNQSIAKSKSVENLNEAEMCIVSDTSSNCAEYLNSEGKDKSAEDLILLPNTNSEISSIEYNLKLNSLQMKQNATNLKLIDDATEHFEVNSPQEDNQQKDQDVLSVKQFLLNSDSDSNSAEHITQDQEEKSSSLVKHGTDGKFFSNKQPLVQKKLQTSFKNNDINKSKASVKKQNIKHKMKVKVKKNKTSVARNESDSNKLEDVPRTLSDKSIFFNQEKCKEFTSDEIIIDENSQQNFDRIPNTSSNANLGDISVQFQGDNFAGKDLSSNDIGCKRKSSENLCSNKQSPYKLICNESNQNVLDEEFYKPVRTKKLKLDNCNFTPEVTNLEEKSTSVDSVGQSKSNNYLNNLFEEQAPLPIESIHNKLVNNLLIRNIVKSQDSPVRFISNTKKTMYKSALVKRIEKDSNLPAGVKIPPKWNTSKIINYSDAIGHSVVNSIVNTKKSNLTGKKIRRSRPTLKIASIQSPNKKAISATKSELHDTSLENCTSDSLKNSNASCNKLSKDKTQKKISARKPVKKSTRVPKKRTVPLGKRKKKIATLCDSQFVELAASYGFLENPDQTDRSKTVKNVTMLCETTQDIVEADIGRSDEDGSELANAIAGVERELLNLPPNSVQGSPKGKLLSLSPDKMQESPKGSVRCLLDSCEEPGPSGCDMETTECGNSSKYMTQEEKLSILLAKVKEFGVDALLEKLDVY